MTNLLPTESSQQVRVASNTARLDRTATVSLNPSPFPRTNSGLPITQSAGIPRTLVTAFYKHVGGARRVDVLPVVVDVRATIEGSMGSKRTVMKGSCSMRRLNPRGLAL